MGYSMDNVLQAVVPVFGIIWLGYIFKKIQMPGDDFWPLAGRITYYVFLPSLFFMSVLKADFTTLDSRILGVLAASCFALIATSFIVFLAQYVWLKLDGKRFASFYQGSIRFNNYIGIPIIISLFGTDGLVIYAIIISLTIPVTNILTVAVMSHYASESSFCIKRVTISIITNPLIIGSLGGLMVNILGIPLYYGNEMLQFFANTAAAVGLLTVGAGIDVGAITSSKRNISVACVIKLIINPLMILLGCLIFSVDGMMRDVAVVYASLPVAASSYIVAKQFHAHAPLMSSIIISTTLISMLTLTLILAFLKI
jgi:predicted permease